MLCLVNPTESRGRQCWNVSQLPWFLRPVVHSTERCVARCGFDFDFDPVGLGSIMEIVRGSTDWVLRGERESAMADNPGCCVFRFRRKVLLEVTNCM